MPTDTAMDILTAYRLKRRQNPAADQATLFKFILWDRFAGKMVADADMADMAASARTLADLTFAVLVREKPALATGRLADSAREAITRYYRINYPDGC